MNTVLAIILQLCRFSRARAKERATAAAVAMGGYPLLGARRFDGDLVTPDTASGGSGDQLTTPPP